MAIDTTPSQVATNALQAIPFGSIIGGPLKACIEAQAMAAQTSWQFIQEVGLNTDPNTGQKEAVNVSFQFMQNGHMVQLNVPLLTIVLSRTSPSTTLTSISRRTFPHPLQVLVSSQVARLLMLALRQVLVQSGDLSTWTPR